MNLNWLFCDLAFYDGCSCVYEGNSMSPRHWRWHSNQVDYIPCFAVSGCVNAESVAIWGTSNCGSSCYVLIGQASFAATWGTGYSPCQGWVQVSMHQQILKERAYWIHHLGSLHPHGLNLEPWAYSITSTFFLTLDFHFPIAYKCKISLRGIYGW